MGKALFDAMVVALRFVAIYDKISGMRSRGCEAGK